MGPQSGCAHRDGLVLVTEGDLLLADAAPVLFFIPTLFGLAFGGMPDVRLGVADARGLTGMLGPAKALATTDRLGNVVREGGTPLLGGWGIHVWPLGVLGLL